MSTPDPWKPSRYSPAPGTERCQMCREILTKDHVRHPWSQIISWLWANNPQWRLLIVLLGVLTTFCLGAVIAAVRDLITGS